jgi:glycosyltransferase involved in cell wall biosynthesis
MAFITKFRLWLSGGVITLKPENKARGAVLLSYTTLPFVSPHTLSGHSNRWECMEIAHIWKDAGFEVDIIDHSNKSFRPKKKYDYCIDAQDSLDYLSPLMEKTCVKVFHIASAHWKFQNEAEAKRLKDIENKKKIKLSPRRLLPSSKNIETCDIATMLGNDFTESTYTFAKKKIIRIPISTTHTFPSPEHKDFDRIRKNFIWLGGSGMAHKGLDLVLEAFAEMPDYHLTVFGKKDEDFAEVYEKELFSTPNIRYVGMVNLSTKNFIAVADNSIGMVFPSCSEGSSGGVVSAMHAGLIPIISHESGVDAHDFGVILRKNTIDEIKKTVSHLASLPTETLKTRAVATWRYARNHHTRESFSNTYKDFVSLVIDDRIVR